MKHLNDPMTNLSSDVILNRMVITALARICSEQNPKLFVDMLSKIPEQFDQSLPESSPEQQQQMIERMESAFRQILKPLDPQLAEQILQKAD